MSGTLSQTERLGPIVHEAGVQFLALGIEGAGDAGGTGKRFVACRAISVALLARSIRLGVGADCGESHRGPCLADLAELAAVLYRPALG
ncbi:MAG TPA: hypothetical protein VGI66_00070 [Streptosporangiaceae bacterium]